jgi:hypothetical protein
MDGALGLKDVSEEDIDRKTGKKSKLKTGSNRSHNMPKACIEKLMKNNKQMTRKEAYKICYSESKEGSLKKMPKSRLKRAAVSAKASIGGAKARRSIKKYEKKSGRKLPQPY